MLLVSLKLTGLHDVLLQRFHLAGEVCHPVQLLQHLLLL
jgi:hypothetical protein